MSKLKEIKEQQLEARKLKLHIRATLLTTLIGEAEMVGKNAGNRETTDAEVLAVIRKFEKNLRENMRIYKERNLIEKMNEALVELLILEGLLPTKIDPAKIASDIRAMNVPLEMKSLGAINKALKVAYGERFDGAQVTEVFKAMLNV